MKQHTHKQEPAYKATRFFSYKMITAISFVVLFGLTSVLMSLRSGNNSAAAIHPSPATGAARQPTPAPTVKRLSAKEPKATLKPEAQAENIRGVLLNSLSNLEVSVVGAIDFSGNANVPGKKDVIITLNQKGAQQDIDSLREAIWKKAVIVLQRVFPVDDTINGVTIDNNVLIRDAAGRSVTSLIIAITFSRKTYNRIDFNNLDYKGIPAIADIYVENPINQ